MGVELELARSSAARNDLPSATFHSAITPSTQSDRNQSDTRSRRELAVLVILCRSQLGSCRGSVGQRRRVALPPAFASCRAQPTICGLARTEADLASQLEPCRSKSLPNSSYPPHPLLSDPIMVAATAATNSTVRKVELKKATIKPTPRVTLSSLTINNVYVHTGVSCTSVPPVPLLTPQHPSSAHA